MTPCTRMQRHHIYAGPHDKQPNLHVYRKQIHVIKYRDEIHCGIFVHVLHETYDTLDPHKVIVIQMLLL